MTKLLIKLIELYQHTPIYTHKLCRYYPTCSQYTKEALEYYGIKGLIKAIKRILRCNPLFKGGYDPLIKENK